MSMWENIKNKQVDIVCPVCGIHKRILINDILIKRIVICPSCENEVKLIDKDSSAIKIKKEISKIESKIKEIF